MRTAFVSALLVFSTIPWLARVQDPVAETPECENIHVHEPRLVYEVSGSTLSGQIDRTLIVYGDGSLKLASAMPNEPGACKTLQVAPEVVSKLYNGLVAAGALFQCDDSQVVVDMPLHTVTLLSGTSEMRGRTFSYWDVDSGYRQIDTLLEQFVAQHFSE
jgi:hypothetical protein